MFLSGIIAWIEKHKWQTALIVVFIFSAPLVLITYIFSVITPSQVITPIFNCDNIIAYFAGFEALLGSLALGLIAIWQNEKLSTISKDANDLSGKLVEIERRRYRETHTPVLLVKEVSLNGFYTTTFIDGNEIGPRNTLVPTCTIRELIESENTFLTLDLNLINVSSVYTVTKLSTFTITKCNQLTPSLISNFGEPDFLMTPLKEYSFQIHFEVNHFSNTHELKFEVCIDTFNHLNELYRQYLIFNALLRPDFTVNTRIGSHSSIPLNQPDTF